MRKFVRTTGGVVTHLSRSLIITAMHLFAFSLQPGLLAGYAFVNPLSGFSEEQWLCMFRRIVALLSSKDF